MQIEYSACKKLLLRTIIGISKNKFHVIIIQRIYGCRLSLRIKLLLCTVIDINKRKCPVIIIQRIYGCRLSLPQPANWLSWRLKKSTRGSRNFSSWSDSPFKSVSERVSKMCSQFQSSGVRFM